MAATSSCAGRRQSTAIPARSDLNSPVWLGIPRVNYSRDVLSVDGNLKALCDMSGGLHVTEVRLPALITMIRRASKPRYATPQGIFMAVATPMERWGADGLRSSPLPTTSDCAAHRPGLPGW